MINYKFPNPDLIPIQASDVDNLLFMKRSCISAVEAAHISCGILPKFDSTHVFMNPFLIEVHQLYKLLIDAAQTGKIRNAKMVEGTFKAPLMNWIQYLCTIDYHIPDLLVLAVNREFDYLETISNKEVIEEDADLVKGPEITNKLHDELKRLDVHFPKIPYKYYFYHPDISVLIGETMLDSSFEDIASSVIQRSRSPGRPRNDFLDDYVKLYPQKEMQTWFAKIKSLVK